MQKFHCKNGIMKCPHYEATWGHSMEKDPAAEPVVVQPKASAPPLKPLRVPVDVTTVLSHNDSDKENRSSREHDRTLDEGFEDSGYLSLQNSQLDEHHGDEEAPMQGKVASALPVSVTQGKTTNPSPSRYHGKKKNSSHAAAVVVVSTPVDRPRRRTAAPLPFTPSDRHHDPKMPILNFERDVCEELAKSYQKNKR